MTAAYIALFIVGGLLAFLAWLTVASFSNSTDRMQDAVGDWPHVEDRK